MKKNCPFSALILESSLLPKQKEASHNK
jgi:hypothetical protein